jgi:3-methyladenine DNA glycosylase AlkD
MRTEPAALIRDLRRTFTAMACLEHAAAAQRYMKTEMPCYGIRAQPLRKAWWDLVDFIASHRLGELLRQYAWTGPDKVIRYVNAHEDHLSGLSKREALKNIARGR